MASSTNARHQSRILRDTARDMSRFDHSYASSTGSHHGTVSDDSTEIGFDPENEAIMSTRRMDYDLSQQLPQIRDTAKKYGRWNGGRQHTNDFVINTSAIGRAFPDFSQGGSSDESSFHVEVGRGTKTKQRTSSRVPQQEYSDNIDSPVVTIGNFKIMGTPPAKGAKPTRQESLRTSARKESGSRRSTPQKENIPPPNAPLSDKKMRDYISGATRNSNGDQRRTLAELHARVADDSDGSFISDERPVTVTFQHKQGRFAAPQVKDSPLSVVHTVSQPQVKSALQDALNASYNAQNTPSRLPAQANTNPPTVSQTQQSFLLPNMPDLSELVSGSFKDGTPVFSRSGNKSRFASGSFKPPPKAHHNELESVPLPEEEKAIFVSLQLLQDKVAMLEAQKADAQKDIEELKQQNYQLEAEKAELQQGRHRRSDSALGMTDGSDGEQMQNKRLISEKTKLEAQLKSIQSRYAEVERKSSNQEQQIKNISIERDQAVKQLAEAYTCNEELQSENEFLQNENKQLKLQLARQNRELEDNTKQLKTQLNRLSKEFEDNASLWRSNESKLREKLQRRDVALSEMKEITQELRMTHSQMTKSKKSSRKERGTAKPVVQQKAAPRVKDSRLDTTVDDSFASDEESFDQTTKTIHKDLNIQTTQPNDTTNFSSLLGHGELQAMREMLADEKRKLVERQAGNYDDDEESDSSHDETARSAKSVRSSRSMSNVSKKGGLTGILKNRTANAQQDGNDTGRFSVKSHKNEGDVTTRSHGSTHSRRHSDSAVKARIPRTRIASEEMTSAFILPDITVSIPVHATAPPALSEAAKKVLDKLCAHNAENCVLCTRILSSSTDNAKSTVQIAKPIPVSDRMPLAKPYEEEPTLRPSVAPGLALATVIKTLQDELAHAKIQLSQWQSVYAKLDVSLGMRKRKAVKSKIDGLLKEVERKADQVYALFDVLEGQKMAGQELSESEVEVTLMDLGVDVGKMREEMTMELNKEEAKGQGRKGNGEEEEGDELESELDLPWEGIEDSTGAQSVRSRGGSRRGSWVA